eukprot:Clim_evm29s246 gene=Clim_evmTU29s246
MANVKRSIVRHCVSVRSKNEISQEAVEVIVDLGIESEETRRRILNKRYGIDALSSLVGAALGRICLFEIFDGKIGLDGIHLIRDDDDLSPTGRPKALVPGVMTSCDFNLSHHGGVVAGASTKSATTPVAIGIDVVNPWQDDSPKPPYAVDGMASVLHSRERDALSAYNADPRLQTLFYHVFWSCKEACLKCTGDGLGGSVDVSSLCLEEIGKSSGMIERHFLRDRITDRPCHVHANIQDDGKMSDKANHRRFCIMVGHVLNHPDFIVAEAVPDNEGQGCHFTLARSLEPWYSATKLKSVTWTTKPSTRRRDRQEIVDALMTKAWTHTPF